MSSAAVIVTYNRLILLKRLVDALRSQTLRLDKIIVVNNSSTDGTAEWLALETDILTITQENIGGAGGFYTGLKNAYHEGYEWILCMDDDGEPALNAVEMLFKANLPVPSAVNCLVVDIDTKKRLPFKVAGYKTIQDIDTSFIKKMLIPFNGTLFHRDVFSRIGFPDADMVIWGDETEFFYRIQNKGKIPTGIVTDAILYHPLNNGKFYLSDWDIIKDWKAYFFIRNKFLVYRSRYNLKITAYLHYLVFSIVFFMLILFVNKTEKLNKLKMLAVAFKHAIKNKPKWTIKEVQDFTRSIKNC